MKSVGIPGITRICALLLTPAISNGSKMFRIPGKQNNTVRYIHDMYTYYQDRRGEGLTFRCATRYRTDCSSVIYLQNLHNLQEQQITVTGEHDHPGDPSLLLKAQFDITIKERARERAAVDKPKQVFDYVCRLD
ncbi:hypothetical protein TSAR_012142 [Trichomalopsis sarcophagae]|uniref:FLYWCH-type domain-containing protein n=1 Tax=Trichomalopsis sarcophagae TaxID=543379 RepID=A0A232EDD9_9HYME|nr:hypothetical protein TSAR_012142 [Trichomalopsis sarcophagae]